MLDGARTVAAFALVSAIFASAQTARDQKMIAYAKALPVSKLDTKLPAIPFERWLQKQAGEGAQITWEVNDCGEQTGSAEESERDLPVCVEADARLRDKRVIVVSIAVGTYDRGISGKPATWWITVGHDPSRDEPLGSLSEVPERLSEHDEAPQPAPGRELPLKKPPGK